MSLATFLSDDGEVSCQHSLTEIIQKRRNGENSHEFDNVCICLLLHLSQTSNLGVCGSFCSNKNIQ